MKRGERIPLHSVRLEYKKLGLVKTRECLRCNRKFKSEGRFNKVCRDCLKVRMYVD